VPSWLVPDMKLVVDRERCMGSGQCIVYAPGTFAHDGETKAVVLDSPTDPASAIEIAVEACPTGAIRVVPDDQGG
jgi:ferredoxin